MIPPFGLSGGGLIAGLDSIKNIGRALHNQDSASAECQRLIQNLHALQLAFQCVEALENNGVNQSYIDAVQAEVDKSLKLLGELFQNVAKPEKRLESAASAGIVSGDLRKARQPISVMEELSRLHSDSTALHSGTVEFEIGFSSQLPLILILTHILCDTNLLRLA
jgi:hypothetical protein